MGINPWRNNRVRVVIRRNSPESASTEESAPSDPVTAPSDTSHQPAPDPVPSAVPPMVPVPHWTIGPRCDSSFVINPDCCCTLELRISEGNSASDNWVYAFTNSNEPPPNELARCNAIKIRPVYPLRADRTLPSRHLYITEPLGIGSHMNACTQLMPTANTQVHIGNTVISAVFDSGSDVSYISTTLVETLDLLVYPSSLNFTSSAVNIGCETVSYTTASIGMRDNRKTHNFMIFEGTIAGCQCVLGVDFFRTPL